MATLLPPINPDLAMLGMLAVLVSLGSKSVAKDMNEMCQDLLNNCVIRKLIIFGIVYITTRDLQTSLLVTLLYWAVIFTTSLWCSAGAQGDSDKQQKQQSQQQREDFCGACGSTMMNATMGMGMGM